MRNEMSRIEKVVRNTVEEHTGRTLEDWDGGDVRDAMSEAGSFVSGTDGVIALLKHVLDALYEEARRNK